jgi:RimJ/RimL family protein N-acetyltransferase
MFTRSGCDGMERWASNFDAERSTPRSSGRSRFAAPRGGHIMDTDRYADSRTHDDPAGAAAVPGLVVRPIRPDDAERLVRFHSRLSLETTRLRFFSPHPHLTAREVARFTTVDRHDRDALVALSGDDIIGVARFDRLAGDDRAEVAFVVADEWQGQGVGAELFRGIADLARRQGIRHLVAMVLPENRAMLDLLRHTGLPATRSWDSGALHVELHLEAAPPVT